MAIKNRAFLSIFSVLTSCLNSSIFVLSEPNSFEFMIASNLQSLKSQQNLVLNRVRHRKSLMTHALVSADSRRESAILVLILSLKMNLVLILSATPQIKKRTMQRQSDYVAQINLD